MQDVTDAAFLRVLSRIGSEPDLVITPYMRSTRTTCAMTEGPMRCLTEQPCTAPIWAQLAGSEPEPLVRDAQAILARMPHVAGINLNAGCPSPLVNRHGAGAALLRSLPVLSDVCMALREALPAGAFSIKCRLGWESADEFGGILETLAAARPDQLIVHGRTRRQLYSGAALREPVAQAVRRMPCPVIANGDINTPRAAAEWLEAVQPAGLMLGRGAACCPYLFRMLRGGAAPTADEMRRYFHALAEETARTLKRYTPAGHCNRMKKYLAFCYAAYFTPEQEHTLRRATQPDTMLRIFDEPLRLDY